MLNHPVIFFSLVNFIFFIFYFQFIYFFLILFFIFLFIFVSTPTPSARKEWISLVGEKVPPKYALVFGKFRQPTEQEGKANGPICACIVDIHLIDSEKGEKGTVEYGPMGKDQCDFIGNRLGYLSFNRTQVPVSNLLQRDVVLDSDTGVLSIRNNLHPRKYFWKVINR